MRGMAYLAATQVANTNTKAKKDNSVLARPSERAVVCANERA